MLYGTIINCFTYLRTLPIHLHMKYIVTVDEDDNQEIFIFPAIVHHSIFAESIARMKDQSHGNWKRVTRTPISAGFIRNGYCYGESESLGLKSLESDNMLLKKFFQ